MSDKHIRMTVEFDIDQEALDEHGLTPNDILKHLAFVDDDVTDGFRLSTAIPGLDPTSHFFLCDGKIVSTQFIQERSHGDGLDKWREMVREEIDLNGETCYDLSSFQVAILQADNECISALAKLMQDYLNSGKDTEYTALDKVFDRHFPEVLAKYQENHPAIPPADLCRCDDVLFFTRQQVFLGPDGNLFCRLSDEDTARPLRSRIEDVREGDAFFYGNSGAIRTTSDNASRQEDADGTAWVVYGNDGEVYFEHDIGTDLYETTKKFLDYIQGGPSNSVQRKHSRDNSMEFFSKLDKALHNDEFRAEFYSDMDEAIADAIESDTEKPNHKYWQLVNDYITGSDKFRKIVDGAVCSITGWNLSTILKNSFENVEEFQPIEELLSSAQSRSSDAHNQSIEKDPDRGI